MLLEDIVANETYEKRKRRAMDREYLAKNDRNF